MNEKKPAENCNHQWKKAGYWDGEEDSCCGPIAKCMNCDGTSYFTWKKWKALPEEVRTELMFIHED